MNQFFSFKRFTLLVIKHWADNKKRYGLSMLAFIGLLITWFVFTMLTGMDDTPMGRGAQQITFFLSLFAVGTFYASQYFRDLSSRAKGINFLMVPASAFEKLLCSLLYSVLLFFIVFTAAFYLVDFLMVAIANTLPGSETPAQKVSVINVFKVIILRFNKDSTVNFLLFFFSVQSVFLLGSVYFEKYSFIKTIISGFVGAFILFCFMYFFTEYLLPDGDYPMGFLTAYRVYVDGVRDQLIQIPHWIGDVFRFLAMYGIAPFLWIVTYYRLKEKQV
ncbi:MAG: hypothetical protein EOO10_04345 [Chitinophagaceae bacterium]|nr:MAG: hypothetical protein EOO10_04345 [Chitinophagaceae bacterium]